MNQGLLVDTTGVAVTVPVCPPPVTVSDTVVLRDTLPEVPVRVTVATPNVAVLDAAKVAVTELPVVAVDGLKDTVTPLGNPVATKLTAPVKLVRLIATEVEPLAPRAAETAAAEPSVKSLVPVPVTVNETLVDFDSEPEVPVSVTVAATRVAVLEAVKVAVTVLPVVAPLGLNATVTPLGRPLALIVTAPVKFVRLIATEVEPLAPRATDSVPGDAATL